MPELPEVETTKAAIAPHLIGKTLTHVIARRANLRYDIPISLLKTHVGESVTKLERRAKYLLVHFESGIVLLHLGMSGRLRVLEKNAPYKKHDHVIFEFGDLSLRLEDPRRFGMVLHLGNTLEHPLLDTLGPEPLSKEFNVGYFTQKCSSKRTIKSFIMDSHIVVGVGNIYANEALFLSGILPNRHTCSLSAAEIALLVKNIKRVLKSAIEAGGTSFRDFVSADGKPGYFQQALYVYGRAGEPCKICQNTLEETRQGGRSTVICTNCQQ